MRQSTGIWGRWDPAFGVTTERSGVPEQVRGRRPRKWAAIAAVAAMALMGATPALADEGAPDSVVPDAPAEVMTAQAEAPAEPAPEAPTPVESAPADPPPTAPPTEVAPEPEPPAPTAPAPESAPPAAPSTAAPSDTADTPGSDAPQAAAAVTEEAAPSEPEPPYLRWVVVDAAHLDAGAVQTPTKIAVQGPRNPGVAADAAEEVQWGGSPAATIEDNTGQEGYTGLDLDPRVGWFTVEQLIDDVTLAEHEVAANERYRLRPAEVPAGFAAGDAAEWSEGDSLVAPVLDPDVQKLALQVAPVPEPETSDEALDDGEAELLNDALDGPGIIMPLMVGTPEGATPPYVHWEAKDADDNPLEGVRFEIAGPRTSGGTNGWGTVRTVTDCVTDPCPANSLDKDPDPGEFVVKYLNPGGGNQQQVSTSNRYRVRVLSTPSGYETGSTDWSTIPQGSGNANSASWNNDPVAQTHDFGDWTFTQWTTPYVVWTAEDNSDNLLGGATFSIQGPRTSSNNWGTTRTVTDCVAAPCTGLDADPTPGAFKVKYLSPSSYPSETSVLQNSRYRVQVVTPPPGYSADNTNWVQIGGNASGNSSTWPAAIYDFGAFTNSMLSHTIVVRKGDIRTGIDSGSINVASQFVVGARFGLYESQDAATAIDECTIVVAADGCQFTNVAYSGVQLWIGELAPLAGSTAALAYSEPLGTLTTGSSSGFTDRPYRYATPTLGTTSQTYTLPQASGSDTGGSWANSSQRYANRLHNPQLNLTCAAGVNVALVMDLSGSVAEAGKADDLKNAALGFVDALGAQSNVALFSFGNTSPRENTVNQASPLNVGTQRTQIDTIINNYRTWTVVDQGTNWDAGMWQASQGAASYDYDIVLVLTDGNPTFSGTSPDGTGSLTTFRELERAIFSSNVIKQQDTRIMTVGIGGNLSNYNLAAVSGPQGYAAGKTLNEIDYVVTDWSALKELLEKFAAGLECKGDITVTKLASNDGQPPVAAAGWEFEVTGGAPGTLDPVGKQTTPASGSVTWDLVFASPTASGDVTITETQQAANGWVLADLSCTVNGAEVDVDVELSVTIEGVGVGDSVHCTYTNTKTTLSNVQVTKSWVVNGETYADGEQPEVAGSATLTLDPLPSGVTEPVFGTSYQYSVGSTVTVNEQYTPGSPLCTLDSKQVTSVSGSPQVPGLTLPYAHTVTALPNPNTIVITNTVTCLSQLTLLKEVDTSLVPDTTLQPADWELTATDGTNRVLDAVPGATTPSAVNTADVTADTVYTLSEASVNGQLAYAQLGIQLCKTVTGIGPSASCTEWEPGYISGDTATVALGEHEIYRFVNQPIPPITVPLTGGMSAELFGLWGAGLAILAVLAAAFTTSRIRRQREVR